MSTDLLLREGRIGTMKMRNRIIMGPMGRNLVNRDGSLTQAYIDFLVARAKAGASLILVEGAMIDETSSPGEFLFGVHAEHVVPGLRRLAEAVHAEGANLAAELCFSGRGADVASSQRQQIAPSPVPCEVLSPLPIPREMTWEDMDYVVKKFVEAANRVVSAGFDMIHLHGHGGYLLTNFLSPFTNRRTDEYGGTLANRARFPLEVVAAVRAAVGAHVPIGYRLCSTEYVDGGLEIGEATEFSLMLADSGIDLIDVAGGIYESMIKTIQSAEAPKGGEVEHARIIKQAVGDRVAVTVGQKLNDPAFANEVMRRDGLDFVSLARAFHADPEYMLKLAEDRVDDIVPCIGCLTCMDLASTSAPTRCSANPATGLERRRQIRRVATPRRVGIVGGGLAGMEAARMLALSGHSAVLFEATDELGGQIRYSSRVWHDYADLVDYLTRQLSKLGVDIRLETRLDLEALKDFPADTWIFATGARGGPIHATRTGSSTILDIFSAFQRDGSEWSGRIVINGGDGRSCTLAQHLATLDLDVHVIEPRADFAFDKGPFTRGRQLELMANLPTVTLHPASTLEEGGSDYVIIQRAGEFQRLDGVGTVVAGGVVAENALYERVMAWNPELEVYPIGDSVRPRSMLTASQEAADAVELIGLYPRP